MSDGIAFPNDWPSNCPPIESRQGPQDFYRIAKAFPPDPNEFQSAFERGVFKNGCPCRRRGLSVLQDLDDALHGVDANPGLGSVILKGTVGPEHGKFIETPASLPSHVTWWPASGIDPHIVFSEKVEIPNVD
jgi:hypothetical protein